MKKQISILTLVLLALLPLPTAARAQANDPAAVVTGFLTNIDDPSKSITYLADDVHIQIIPAPLGITGGWDGKAGAQAYAQFSKNLDTKVEMLGDWMVNGGQVSGTVKVDVVDFRKLGVSP